MTENQEYKLKLEHTSGYNIPNPPKDFGRYNPARKPTIPNPPKDFGPYTPLRRPATLPKDFGCYNSARKPVSSMLK